MTEKRKKPQAAADALQALELDTPDFHPDDGWLEQLAKLLILANGREAKHRRRSHRESKNSSSPKSY